MFGRETVMGSMNVISAKDRSKKLCRLRYNEQIDHPSQTSVRRKRNSLVVSEGHSVSVCKRHTRDRGVCRIFFKCQLAGLILLF